MSENKNNNPKGVPNNNPNKQNEPTINKGQKKSGEKQPFDKIDDEDQIENPDKNREHDDTDHEHDYKTPSDNSFNQKNQNEKSKNISTDKKR